MFEIVERSNESGGVSMIYSGYETAEEAQLDADFLASDPVNEGYWYEVRQEIG